MKGLLGEHGLSGAWAKPAALKMGESTESPARQQSRSLELKSCRSSVSQPRGDTTMGAYHHSRTMCDTFDASYRMYAHCCPGCCGPTGLPPEDVTAQIPREQHRPLRGLVQPSRRHSTRRTDLFLAPMRLVTISFWTGPGLMFTKSFCSRSCKTSSLGVSEMHLACFSATFKLLICIYKLGAQRP